MGYWKSPKLIEDFTVRLKMKQTFQNKGSLAATETGSGGCKPSGPPSMADVLKGLNSVKLRSVQRLV